MGYTNSSLVVYKKLSPNHSGQRTHSIDRITPHCVVGQCSAEGLGDWFAASSTQASSNYGIDKDGRVGLYVEEKNRSWCSSSNANDQRAITIECASDTSEPYAFRDAVYQKLITLCVDICKRNGKKKLIWFGDKDKTLNYSPKSDEMVLTVHRWFANKSCPGNWMYARMGDLASKVTAKLGGSSSGGSESSGSGSTSSGTNTKFPETPFLVTVIIDDLKIHTEGSMSGKVVGQTGKGVFTITKVKNGWGKLKSGAGWIYLENASYCTIGKTVSSGKESPQEGEKTEGEVKEEKVSGLQATELKSLSEAEAVAKMGPYFTADQKKFGVLASVTAAQFILESGYGKSELAQNANNCFGMKKSLSGNTWEGSAWDGKSVYTKKTQEQNTDGSYVTITADFRKYPCVEDSIADHSAYLLGAKNGSNLRYAGLKGCTDYKKAAQIIKDGGYATSLTYVDKLCEIIERWNLTQYDVKAAETPAATAPEQKTEEITLSATHSKYINSTGTHYISNSGSDENGAYTGGKAGDQTGTEWRMRNWYNRPWSVVLRYPDQRVALKIALLGIDAALNDHIGYDQSQNRTYLAQLKKVGWEPSRITVDCEADCSAGVCANITAAGHLLGIKALQDHTGTYTGNMKNALVKAGFKALTDSKYLTSGDYLLPGDILLYESHHTATNVTIGSKVKGSWNPGTGAATQETPTDPVTPTTPTTPATKYYRVRKIWENKASQIGAFTVLQNAINCVDANPGYAAFDDSGKQVYPKVETAFSAYRVRVSVTDLNYRKGPSTSYKSRGYIEPGIYTIVDEQDGWGLLKAYAGERNGWICLKYAEKV